jgi:hypothetical protein
MIWFVGISILIVVLVAVLVFRFIKNSKVWVWPKGAHFIGHYQGFTAHLFVKGALLEFPPDVVAYRAALAAWCLNQTLGNVPTKFGVHVCEDTFYDKTYDAKLNTKSNGLLLKIQRKAGKETMPLVVCRSSVFHETPINGSLVLHELIHAALPFSLLRDPKDPSGRNHSDRSIWIAEDSLEMKTRKLFMAKLLEET